MVKISNISPHKTICMQTDNPIFFSYLNIIFGDILLGVRDGSDGGRA
jgi:hypothetical protein